LKLSKRLKQIEQMVTAEYDHIWDCCCDHGFLGAALLSRDLGADIHFVDIVPELMTQLENKLEKFYPQSAEKNRWKTHCIDVAKLPLLQYKGKHLVIIAGVGGDLMMEFINGIYTKHQDVDIDFLLCPVHHQFALRQRLIELDFGLKHEVLVEENKRFYEVIYVSSKRGEQKVISPVGDSLWQAGSDHQTGSDLQADSEHQKRIAKQYLNKTLSHYQRIQLGNSHKVQHIIDAYNKVNI
jgi:tRNA (adenine22-N1)-methyltransferase